MAGGVAGAADDPSWSGGYGGRVTFSVVVTCLIAASCGLIYGYDNGISGGVSQMESFLSKFFPEVATRRKDSKHDVYCKYDDQWLTAFTSSLFIAATLSSLVASRVTRRVGRHGIMRLGGALFVAGSVVNGAAANVAMLVVGRVLLVFGIGFTFQAAPVYLSETAPARWRGAFASAMSFFLVLGVLCAHTTNYLTDRIPGWGWRVSLGLAAVPGGVVLVGALFVSDSPSSLVLRGHPEQARAVLRRIRGGAGTATDGDADVDGELEDIVRAVEEARRNDDGAFRRLFSRPYRRYLVMGVAMPVFYELTGMTVISVFLPLLFRTVGFSSQRAILGSVAYSAVNLAGTSLSSLVMDRTGRRALLIAGGLGIMLSQVGISWIMAAAHLEEKAAAAAATTIMPRSYATGMLVLVMLCAFSFSTSWSAVRWPVLSEIYPVEVRSAGQAVSISVWLCLTFAELQAFTKMLCAMRHAVFLFHAACLLAATIFVALLLPETKGVPLEAMRSVWTRHWYWRRFAKDDDRQAENPPQFHTRTCNM